MQTNSKKQTAQSDRRDNKHRAYCSPVPTLLSAALAPLFMCMAGEAMAVTSEATALSSYRFSAPAGPSFSTSPNGKPEYNFSHIDSKLMIHDDYTGKTGFRLEYDTEATDLEKFNNRHLIMDGGMHAAEGEIFVKNAQVTMQGWADHFNGDFDDALWTERGFRFEKMTLRNANLSVGRNAWLEGTLDIKNSHVRFGGDVPVFHDKPHPDRKQHLVQGNSRFDEEVHFKGHIKAEDSTVESYMSSFQASFDLKNSSFINHDKTGLTFVLHEGIKLKDHSNAELGNIKVVGNWDPGFISISNDSRLSVQDVHVVFGRLHVPDNVAHGTLHADRWSTITVNNWNLKNTNLVTASNGNIIVNNLTTSGAQRAIGNITVNNSLSMNDLDPNTIVPIAGKWVGLDVTGTLTLEKDVHVKAHFSNDFLSVNNVKFNRPGTLIRAGKLIDKRAIKDVEYDTHGIAVDIETEIKDNRVILTFTNMVMPAPPPKPDPAPDQPDGGVTPPDSGITPPDSGTPDSPDAGTPDHPDSGPDDVPTQQEIQENKEDVIEDFFEQGNATADRNELQSVIEHNKNGDLLFQEVAIQDALTMNDSHAGAEALHAIAQRTEQIKLEAARTLNQSKIVAPVRRAIDTRLASLRRSARSSTASYTPVAASGRGEAVTELSRVSTDNILNQSIFVDVSGSLLKDDDRKEQTFSSNIGYDRVWKVDGGRVVTGAAVNLTKIDNSEELSSDDAMMYGITGYLSLEQNRGFEYQTYLTAGYLFNDRSFTPKVAIGEQRFDERSVLFMSSNYLKYHFQKGKYSIRPMLLADLGWHRIGKSESTWLKRDSLSQAVLDLGVGIELEGSYESVGYMLQATAKTNVWTSDNTVGINLINANGYMSYDIPEDHDAIFSVNGALSKRLLPDVTLDLAIGGSITSEGALGIHGNGRIRWHF